MVIRVDVSLVSSCLASYSSTPVSILLRCSGRRLLIGLPPILTTTRSSLTNLLDDWCGRCRFSNSLSLTSTNRDSQSCDENRGRDPQFPMLIQFLMFLHGFIVLP